MLSTSTTDTTTPNGSDQEQTYQVHLQALQDRLLLFLRDGAWHPPANLTDWPASIATAAGAADQVPIVGT
jgi:hypothetical protein